MRYLLFVMLVAPPFFGRAVAQTTPIAEARLSVQVEAGVESKSAGLKGQLTTALRDFHTKSAAAVEAMRAAREISMDKAEELVGQLLTEHSRAVSMFAPTGVISLELGRLIEHIESLSRAAEADSRLGARKASITAARASELADARALQVQVRQLYDKLIALAPMIDAARTQLVYEEAASKVRGALNSLKVAIEAGTKLVEVFSNQSRG